MSCFRKGKVLAVNMLHHHPSNRIDTRESTEIKVLWTCYHLADIGRPCLPCIYGLGRMWLQDLQDHCQRYFPGCGRGMLIELAVPGVFKLVHCN